MAHNKTPSAGDAAVPLPPAPDISLALNGVWLGTEACLMQGHVPAPPGEPLVIHVVGVSDCGNHTGWVLMQG